MTVPDFQPIGVMDPRRQNPTHEKGLEAVELWRTEEVRDVLGMVSSGYSGRLGSAASGRTALHGHDPGLGTIGRVGGPPQRSRCLRRPRSAPRPSAAGRHFRPAALTNFSNLPLSEGGNGQLATV